MASSGCKQCSLAILLLLTFGRGEWGPSGTHAGKVLGFFQLSAYSHFVMMESLMREMAARGHQVTVVSHFPQKPPRANYTDISMEGVAPMMVGGFTIQETLKLNILTQFHLIWNINYEICEKTMENPEVQKILNSKEHYDLVVVEVHAGDCGYLLAWKLGAPLIGMTSLARMPWGHFRMGNPDNPAYFPLVYTSFSSNMNFWQRLINTGAYIYAAIGERLTLYAPVDALNKRLVGPDVPSLDDLLCNTSLVLINSHFSLNGALPNVPGIVEVGGMHVAPDRKHLSESVRDWLDGADENGVVYVSFGSLVRPQDMPLPQLKAMTNVLGSLPHRVLWKCLGATVVERLGHELPNNILTDNWLPQASVLEHPKIRVFVSHGGLMGIQENLYRGKPMVVVPLFSDQYQDATLVEERGMAKKLYFHDITEEKFGEALRAVLDDPSYAENARRVSLLFHDRPRPPLEEAVYWAEYVMRHRGAPHLRSAAVHLSWWQLWLLDIVAAIVISIVTLLLFLRYVLRLLFSRTSQKEKKIKRS